MKSTVDKQIDRRGWGKKVFLAGASLLLALGLGELLVRALQRAPDIKSIAISSTDCVYQRSSNPLLSFELKPNYRSQRPDFHDRYESTNSHGQRDRQRSLKKSAGTYRVILLGDSVVEGHGLPEADTLSRQWEHLASTQQTEVLNFGVSGYCTRSEVELLEVKGLAFQPDAVVLVFVENDFHNFNREAFVLNSPRPAGVNSLFRHSHLFRLAAVQGNLWHFGRDAEPAEWNQRAIGENNVVDGLRRLSQLSRRDGFATLLAVWPSFTDDAVIDLHYMPGNSSQLVVERLARMFQIPTVRLSADFVKDSLSRPGGKKPRLTYTIGDGMHPSAVGCSVAARALKEHLARLEHQKVTRSADRDESAAGPQDNDAFAAARALGGERPTQGRVFNNIGKEMLAAGKYDSAIEYFQMALREDNNLAEAHNNWGNALNNLGRPQEAISHYQEAARIKPDFAEVHNNWGNVVNRLGRPQEAVPHYEDALKVKPDYAEAHNNLANTLESLGRPQEAIRHYQETLRIKPDFAEAHYNLGNTLHNQGRSQEAIPHFQEALRIKPDFAQAHYDWGNALNILRRPQEAIPHYQEALRIKPDFAEAQHNWGNTLALQGNLSEAVAHYQQALRLNPGYEAARVNLRRAQEALLRQNPSSAKP